MYQGNLVRRTLQLLFGMERWDRVSRWLIAILAGAIAINTLYVLASLIFGESFFGLFIIINFLLLVLYIVLLLAVRHGANGSMDTVGDGEEMFRRVFQKSPMAINLTALKDGRLLQGNTA